LSAGPSIALSGMPGWYGKRFLDSTAAVNLQHRGDQWHELLPMTCSEQPSWLDGQPCAALGYGAATRRPWRWVRDELRQLDEAALPVPDLCRSAGPAPAGLSLPAGTRGMSEAFDVLIIGSGFGGSVSALRLAEKGYRVAVLEQGREHSAADFQRSGQSMRHLLWAPALGLRGPLAQKVYRNVGVVHGVGVGVAVWCMRRYCWNRRRDSTAIRPGRHWMTTGRRAWHRITGAPGRCWAWPTIPIRASRYQWLAQTAAAMGAAGSYGAVPQGIYFGPQNEAVDPFFAGKGPLRRGCNRCGSCISGCPQGAKNSLDLNYLYLARQLGVQVFSDTRVSHISHQGKAIGYICTAERCLGAAWMQRR